MNHDRTPRTLGKSDLKSCAVGPASREQSVGKEVRSVERKWMDAEEIYELGDVVGPKRTVADFLAAGPDDDGMKLIVLANAVNDQPCPVDRHRITCLPVNNPEWRFIGQVPGDDRALVGIVAAEFRSEIGFETQ